MAPAAPPPVELGEGLVRLAQAYALFEYLSVGLDAAVAVHERLLAMLQQVPQPASTATGGGGGGAAVPSTPPQPLLSGAGSAQHEALLEHYARLLHSHAATHPTPPARLRSLLERGLAAFPANSTLLGLLVGGRASAHRRFAVRRLLSGLRRAHPACPQLWVASVALELNDAAPPPAAEEYGGEGSSTLNAVSAVSGVERRARGLYEAALRPEACGACAALWRAYLALEVACGRRDAACRLLLRAVQACPGAKALWRDALRPPLLGWLPAQQLQDLLQLVSEKELRLRHELPELDELMRAAAAAAAAAATAAAAAAEAAADAAASQLPPPAASCSQLGARATHPLRGRRAELGPPHRDRAEEEEDDDDDDDDDDSSSGSSVSGGE